MKTSPVTPADLARSVIAVPPLARHRDLTISTRRQSRADPVSRGGRRAHAALRRQREPLQHRRARIPELLDMLEEEAGDDTWVIPSVGPDYGKLMDQARGAEGTRTSPPRWSCRSPSPPRATASRRASAASPSARQAGVVYIKADNYLEPDAVARARGRRPRRRRSSTRPCAAIRATIHISARCSTSSTRAHRERHRRAAGDRAPARLRPAGLHVGLRLRRAAQLDEDSALLQGAAMGRGGCRSARRSCRWRIAATRTARSACCTTR